VGSNGLILRTTSSLSGINTITNEIPGSFSLRDNYPNPFNPATVIEYQLSSASYVKLIVYDMYGKEIKTLVNENESAGTYRTSFDGTNLSSGIYFYRLETEGYRETKKMILVK
jgi:hypothetical protein